MSTSNLMRIAITGLLVALVTGCSDTSMSHRGAWRHRTGTRPVTVTTL
jgi:hypothetical protein